MGYGSDMLQSDLSAARQPEISDPHSVCRLNHRFARDGLQGGCSKAGQPASLEVLRAALALVQAATSSAAGRGRS